MAKNQYHITLDEDVITEMRLTREVNWSDLINDFLKSYLENEPRNDEEFDKIKQELEENEQKKLEIVKKISKLKFNLASLKDKRDIQAKEKKEKMDKLKRCLGCDKGLREKFYTLPNGNVCRSCYFTASKEKMSEWGFA